MELASCHIWETSPRQRAGDLNGEGMEPRNFPFFSAILILYLCWGKRIGECAQAEPFSAIKTNIVHLAFALLPHYCDLNGNLSSQPQIWLFHFYLFCSFDSLIFRY